MIQQPQAQPMPLTGETMEPGIRHRPNPAHQAEKQQERDERDYARSIQVLELAIKANSQTIPAQELCAYAETLWKWTIEE